MVHCPSAMHAPARCAPTGAEYAPARGSAERPGLPVWRRRMLVAAAGATLCAAVLTAGGLEGVGGQPASLSITNLPSSLSAEDRGLGIVVSMLAAEVKAPGVCDKRLLIMEKLEALLTRLGARAVTLSAADAQQQREAETALRVSLEVETLYRMSEEKFDQTTQAAEFVLQQMEVAQRVEELTQKSVHQLIEEYPGKKAAVSAEKQVLLDIIDLVEKLDFSSLAPQSKRAAEQRLRQLRAEALVVAEKAGKTALRDELAKLGSMKSRLAHMQGGSGTPEQRGQAATSKLDGGGATQEDVMATKSAVLKILYDLLKEPEFREHLLNEGLKAAQARLEADKAKVQELQEEEVKLASQASKAREEGVQAEMERNKDAGHNIAKEAAYVAEHKEYLATNTSDDKGVFIIKAIIDKINEYCDKQGGAKDDASNTQQEAAVMPLLAVARAAAEADLQTPA